jgi:capsular polysaccharide export protein
MAVAIMGGMMAAAAQAAPKIWPMIWPLIAAARCDWTAPPSPGLILRCALPRAIPGHPQIAFCRGGADPAPPPDPQILLASLAFWPAPRFDALKAAHAVALPAGGAVQPMLALARGMFGGDAVAIGAGRAARIARKAGWRVVPSPAHLRPEGLLGLIGAPGAPPLLWAALAGIPAWAVQQGGAPVPVDVAPWAARLRWTDPWTGRETTAEAGLDALIALRGAAAANDRPIVTAGLTPWKRRCAAPFLAGPCGPARHVRTEAAAARAAARVGGRVALWGTRGRAPDALRLEDGFIRSVGLGLRHTPPASLSASIHGLHFDCTRIGDLERVLVAAAPGPDALSRAARLRARLIAEGVTKYNLTARAAPLPDTSRLRVLVPGQVEDDASLRWGAPGVRRNADLLRAARARHPGAFILWRPHPDVETGMRPGAVDAATLAACADGVARDASAQDCLSWADRVDCMTSLMGFEALLRGIPVATYGRPFYAGWGLTEDLSPALPHPAPPAALTGPPLPPRGPGDLPFSRGRRLALDTLVWGALIAHPRCIDPATRLPATPERLLDAIAEDRAAATGWPRRVRDALRGATSRVLNRLG